MVDLPSIPEGVPQLRAPQTRLSGADIAAPFAMLAHNLDKAGELVEKDIAIPFAEKAGREAVTTGPDGEPIIQKMPIFGAASAAAMRAAKMTALTHIQPEMENHLTDLRMKFPNDPKNYKIAADEYIKSYTDKIGDGDLQQSALKIGLDNAGQNYRGLVVQADHTSVANTLVGLQSRLSEINERGSSLARQGGTGTPEYQRLNADREAIYKELQSDPRFHFPTERVGLELKANRDADVVEGVVGDVQREFVSKKNLPAAQRALQDAFWGPGSENLGLTPAQRNKGVTEGLHTLERLSVEDKVATSTFQSATSEYIKNLQHAPATYNEGYHNNMVARARELGDYKTLAQLDVAKQFVPVWGAIKALGPTEAPRVAAEISKGVVPALPVRLQDRGIQSKIEAEATRQGIPPQFAVAVAAIESGGNPRAVSAGGNYRGIFQLGNEEFARAGGVGDIHDVDQNIGAGLRSLKAKSDAFTKEFGRAPDATEAYLMHQQGEAGARMHLANPDTPAWQNMLATGEGKRRGEAWAKAAIWGNLPQSAKDMFGSVENVTSRDFVGAWRQKVQGIPYEGTGMAPGMQGTAIRNPYVYKLWEDTVKSTREQLGKNAEHMATQIITQANNGDPVPADTLNTFVTSAVSSGNEQLLERIRPALAAQDARAQVRAGGPSQIAALESQITAIKASGADPVQYQMLERLKAGIEQDAQMWKKDPLQIGAATKLVEPVHQIDTTDPQAAVAEFGQREAKLKVLQGSNRGIGPASVLTGNEGETLKTALVQGDSKNAGALLGGLAQLSPETYRATMASPEMKEALSGMIRSRDPARMTAGFAALDKYWQQDSWGFESTFGGGALTHLQAWQGLKDSFTAPEIAERLNKSEEPGMAKSRADLKGLAHDEIKAWQPNDVAYQIGTGWWGIGRVTGSTPSAPTDLLAQRELMHDFGNTYEALRTYGVDPDKAKELAAKRVKAEWGPSPTVGNQVMKYPPEAYYKPIDGSHAWLADSLREAVTGIKGPQVSPDTTGSDIAGTTMPRANWTIKGLVADAQTQSEVAAGKPPSYRIAIDTGQGLTEILTDPRTGQTRFAFDRNAAIAGSEQRMGKLRADDQQNRMFRARAYGMIPSTQDRGPGVTVP